MNWLYPYSEMPREWIEYTGASYPEEVDYVIAEWDTMMSPDEDDGS